MSKIGFYLKSAPFSSSRSRTLHEIAKAAIDKGHQVFIFLDLDGVLNVVNTQKSLEVLEVPRVRFDDLIEKGATVYVCGTCLTERGLYDPDLFNTGIKTGIMDDLAAVLGEVDKLVTL